MDPNEYTFDCEKAWCPGCGNYSIHTIVKQALAELDLRKENICFVSGIGQAAKSPQYYDVSYFNGLHGRALPAACGIKAAQPDIKVIVESGDGDMYGEGGNHFIHTIRRNPDITVLVHDNMLYGLTKGQASPTSLRGMVTSIQLQGVCSTPLNPLALALSAGASFVARGAAGEPELTREIIKQAIQHRGFALVDIFQACVSFNKFNTHQWYQDNTAPIEDGHNITDKFAAFELCLREFPWLLGIFYNAESETVFEDTLFPYQTNRAPLYTRERDFSIMQEIMGTKK
jgi:2-oxoglutarate/2-oxoacid ferredoxin oxidoreductase subunit beta